MPSPHPCNAKEVARFLGMTAWYRHFIGNFAELAEPLYKLERRRIKFVCDSEAQNIFEKLKKVLTKVPVLVSA